MEEAGTVNGINLAEYYRNLVLMNGSYTEINSKVVFERTFSAGEVFTVNGIVEAGTIYGCDVTDWYNDAILINEHTSLQGRQMNNCKKLSLRVKSTASSNQKMLGSRPLIRVKLKLM